MQNSHTTLLCILMSILFVFSCKQDKVATDLDQMVIWAKDGVTGLNPIINLGAGESEITNKLYFPLADYNPVSLDYEPIYLKALPAYKTMEDGPYQGKPAYDIEFRDDVTWDDGSPVDMHDYIFSLKAIKNPVVNTPRYRAYMANVIDVIPSSDYKSGTVILDEDAMNGQELISNFGIMPEYVYDPTHSMRAIEFQDFASDSLFQLSLASHPEIDSFAQAFNELKNTQETVVGGGPYQLDTWVPDQYIRLVKKQKHWASKSDNLLLVAHPQTIIYSITPDETAALTQLKSDQYDLMAGLNASEYASLQNDSLYANKFDFHAVSLLRYFYIGLNMRQKALAEIEVRQALSYLVNVDTIISSMENGQGERVNSPFLTVDKMSQLTDKVFDPKKASAILKNAGWVDSNQNGILDKTVNDELIELEFNILITGKQLGRFIASLMKQDAEPVGVRINLETIESSELKPRVRGHEFDMIISAATQSLSPYDPYAGYHTDNLAPGKGNNFGFGSAESDALIEEILNEKDEEKRNKAYLALEEILYEEVPMIFLYCPMERIVSKNTIDGVFSVKRPGYFANTFQEKE